jgi:hypothetical protein
MTLINLGFGTIEFGRPKYTTREELYRTADYHIMKDQTADKKFRQYRLCTEHMQGEQGCEQTLEAVIYGYMKETDRFHIQRVEQVRKTGGIPAGRGLPLLLETLEQDMRLHQVRYLTTNCVLKLAHIGVKRYGFQYVDPTTKRDKNARKQGVRAVPLRKQLSALELE